MKFPEHWLRTIVDPPFTSDALAHALTMAGLEVEDRRTPARRRSPAWWSAGFSRSIAIPMPIASPSVASTSERERHCRSFAGRPMLPWRQLVPCARVGAELPGGLKIRQAAVRGVDSQGMLCSASELGLSDDASGLLILDPDAPIGTDLRRVLDLDDVVLELKLTPNRADCLSMLGLGAKSRRSPDTARSRRSSRYASPAKRRGVQVRIALRVRAFAAASSKVSTLAPLHRRG